MEIISPMVTMLAERMRTNPEDFVSTNKKNLVGSTPPKFYEIAQILADIVAEPNAKYYWFLSDVEKEMLMRAYRDLCRKRFEDNCMERLLEDKQEYEGPALGPTIIRAQGRYQTMPWIDPRSLYGQREDLLRQQEDLIRVSASENGINQIQTLSLAQRINGALNKMVGK